MKTIKKTHETEAKVMLASTVTILLALLGGMFAGFIGLPLLATLSVALLVVGIFALMGASAHDDHPSLPPHDYHDQTW